jgi:hypothetical protein
LKSDSRFSKLCFDIKNNEDQALRNSISNLNEMESSAFEITEDLSLSSLEYSSDPEFIINEFGIKLPTKIPHVKTVLKRTSSNSFNKEEKKINSIKSDTVQDLSENEEISKIKLNHVINENEDFYSDREILLNSP